ncbi:MAG: ZIP family metal transporter [Bryobacterales bacterium]|nr:ZIP family metal transporter [Bryobacterales bacterium]
MHLLPEADEALEGRFDYPLALLLASIGVCALLLTERIVFDAVRPKAAANGRSRQGPSSAWVVLIVLSVHSLIAGLALGLEADAAASVLVMLAILFHKGSAAFALVESAQASGATRRQLRTALAVFVSMTPAGIILGTGG